MSVLQALGYELLFLSAGSPETHSEGSPESDAYTVLSDNDLVAARAFGIAYRLDKETVRRYKEHGLDIEKASGRDHQALPVPSVFIVDASGMLRFHYVKRDMTSRFKARRFAKSFGRK